MTTRGCHQYEIVNLGRNKSRVQMTSSDIFWGGQFQSLTFCKQPGLALNSGIRCTRRRDFLMLQETAVVFGARSLHGVEVDRSNKLQTFTLETTVCVQACVTY